MPVYPGATGTSRVGGAGVRALDAQRADASDSGRAARLAGAADRRGSRPRADPGAPPGATANHSIMMHCRLTLSATARRGSASPPQSQGPGRRASDRSRRRHVAEQPLQARRPVVVERDRAARPVRARAARAAAHERRLEDPAARVVQLRPGRRAPLGASSPRQPARAVGVAEDEVRRRDPQPPRRLADRREAGAAQVVDADLRLHRAEPGAVGDAHAEPERHRERVAAQPPAAAAAGQRPPRADGRAAADRPRGRRRRAARSPG